VAPWRAIRSMLLVGVAIGLPGYAYAQGRPGVGLVTTLVGEATVAHPMAARPETLRMRDDVFALDRISTKERSIVHVLMGGKALLTVRELSVVTITEQDGHATVDLQSGKVGLAVVRERMKPGDAIEVQTPHAVAAVRGTVLVVEIVRASAGEDKPDSSGESTNVHLLHGNLNVSLRSNPGGASVQLESLQTVSVSRDILGKMRPLDLATAAAVTTGLKPSQHALTAIPENLQTAVDQRQRGLALVTAAELARGTQSRESGKKPGGKVAPAAGVKASDGGSTLDAIIPVAEVGDGTGGLMGGVFGGTDDSVNSPGASGSSDSSRGGGLGIAVGMSLTGNGGINAGSGGVKGPSLGSWGGMVGSVLTPVTGLPLSKKK
jgi:hypothetical protein